MSENSFFRGIVYRGTCYGSPALTVEMKFDSGEKNSCEFSEGFKKRKQVLLERAEAENFVSAIFKIIEKEEIFSGLRHVDVRYHAEIEWQSLKFINGEKSGKLKLFSTEWHTEEIEHFIKYEAETAEIADRFQKILDKKPHRHALEIYLKVRGFARKYFMSTDGIL